MQYRADRLVALLLSLLLAVTAGSGVRAAEPGAARDATCADCCAYAPDGERCTTVVVCAPAGMAQIVDDETPGKPPAAWAAGVVRAAYIPAAYASWPISPASVGIGPPSYLSFGRFLL